MEESMGVFHIFQNIQMVPNCAKGLIFMPTIMLSIIILFYTYSLL